MGHNYRPVLAFNHGGLQGPPLATRMAGLALTALACHFAAFGPLATVGTGGVMAGYLVANYTISDHAEYRELPG